MHSSNFHPVWQFSCRPAPCWRLTIEQNNCGRTSWHRGAWICAVDFQLRVDDLIGIMHVSRLRVVIGHQNRIFLVRGHAPFSCVDIRSRHLDFCHVRSVLHVSSCVWLADWWTATVYDHCSTLQFCRALGWRLTQCCSILVVLLDIRRRSGRRDRVHHRSNQSWNTIKEQKQHKIVSPECFWWSWNIERMNGHTDKKMNNDDQRAMDNGWMN